MSVTWAAMLLFSLPLLEILELPHLVHMYHLAVAITSDSVYIYKTLAVGLVPGPRFFLPPI